MSKYRKTDVTRLATMFRALASPQRLQIFLQLVARCGVPGCCDASNSGGRCCAGELGKPLDIAASTLSHHLKELRQAGLMRVERRGQKIECWVNPEPLQLLATFFEQAASPAPGRHSAH